MTRLTTGSLSKLSAEVATPSYDRAGSCGVVHLGAGAFHRAHQAAYFDALLARGEAGWMIQGASLRSPAVAEQLNPQDGLFTILERNGRSQHARIAGSIASVLIAPDNPSALVSALAAPSIALVTLTVTEKGYCIDPATGELRLEDPNIRHDIDNPANPRTAAGYLVAALDRRRREAHEPFTVISCDNLPENGQRTRTAVLALAAENDAGLAGWIDQHVAFPSSMVDRIVPATTQNDIASFEQMFGVRDEGLVKTEPFIQWVVQDWFCNRRPPLDTVGVQFTHDVAGWEKAKLRLLNGAHSAIAYLGGLTGHAYIADAVTAPGFSQLVETLWDEAQATLPSLDGFDAAAYRRKLFKRFVNTSLEHRTHQIAMDGSQKLPQRWLNTIREYRAIVGLVPRALTLSLASWMRWQSGRNDAGETHHVDDPMAEQTALALREAGEDAEVQVRNLLALKPIFGDDLPNDEDFVGALITAYRDLLVNGAAQAVAAFATGK